MRVLLNTHKRKLTIDVLLRRINLNCFTFADDVQGDISELATSAIELILSGIDIPTALALEDENGKYQIVSQGNALNAVIQFIDGSFALGESKLVEGISNKYVDDLDLQALDRIVDYTVSISTCLSSASTEEEIKSLVESFKALQW